MGNDISDFDSFRPVSAVVIGNGPSAKLLDFEQLRPGHVASVGMNAAYRYWDRINFRPTYYICMDTVVIMSHAEKIYELINEGRIRKFFLRDELKDRYPDLDGHPRVLWFDEVRTKIPIFDTHFITTGSWAIRWMAYEGIRLITTIGIDANYLELLAEAERLDDTSDLKLGIKKTPDFNPNYFFSDYQQAGDIYNIPNSPEYKEKTGKLVHVEALRKVLEDFDRLKLSVKVFDASPLSNHCIFEKKELDALFSEFCFPLVTSFFVNAPADELTNNLSIAAYNARNPFISVVLILLEGDRSILESKIPPEFVAYVRSLEQEGSIKFVTIHQRPNYLDLFNNGRKLATKSYVVANADIVIGLEAASIMGLDRVNGVSGIFALTRWNSTENGEFLQCVSGSPPWPETVFEGIDYKQRNYLSYDAYSADIAIPLPSCLEDVYIGTFGCDTAIAALFRTSGFTVTNPCLRYRTTHHDNKIRDYSSDVGASQMKLNGEIVRKALSERYSSRPFILDSLDTLSKTRMTVMSFGRPHPYGVWQMLFRVFGASPWHDSPRKTPILFKHIVVERDLTHAAASDLLREIIDSIESHSFIEIEVQGAYVNEDHWLHLFNSFEMLREAKERLYRYDWHSVIYVDHATDDEKKVHTDITLIIKSILGIGSSGDQYVVVSPVEHKVGSVKAPGQGLVIDVVPEWYIAKSALLHGSLGRGQSKSMMGSEGTMLPRLLVVDATAVGSNSATGQVKQVFLGDWPPDRVMQICMHGHNLAIKKSMIAECAVGDTVEELLLVCQRFKPDVIYFRPTDSIALFDFTKKAVEILCCPVALHMMDDWPERLRVEDPVTFDRIDPILRSMIHTSAVRMSICEAMSTAYLHRYGVEFQPLSNGIDLRKFKQKDWMERLDYTVETPFLLRYMGGLADDMNYSSVMEVAEVVSSISEEYPIKFEIYTMPWYLKQANDGIKNCKSVNVFEFVPLEDYPVLLNSSDALLVTYNFDEKTLRYVGLSFANKVPEIMASGVPIIAYGPPNIPTIEYLSKTDCSIVVTDRSGDTLRSKLISLLTNSDVCKKMGERAREHAVNCFRIEQVKGKFRELMVKAAACKRNYHDSHGVMLGGDFGEANRLLRSGHYDDARKIYLKLLNERPLKIYRDNLEIIERKDKQ